MVLENRLLNKCVSLSKNPPRLMKTYAIKINFTPKFNRNKNTGKQATKNLVKLSIKLTCFYESRLLLKIPW